MAKLWTSLQSWSGLQLVAAAVARSCLSSAQSPSVGQIISKYRIMYWVFVLQFVYEKRERKRRKWKWSAESWSCLSYAQSVRHIYHPMILKHLLIWSYSEKYCGWYFFSSSEFDTCSKLYFYGQNVICFSNLFGMVAMEADKMWKSWRGISLTKTLHLVFTMTSPSKQS